jgi:hypothetical protein
MNSIADAVKKLYARLSPATRGALVVLLIVIPDWVSRGGFWYGFALGAWPFLKQAYASPFGKLTLIALAFVLIWLDQRRIGRARLKSYDLGTFKGRALKLRDDIQEFYNNAPQPAGGQIAGENRDDFTKRVLSASSRRVDYLVNGYAWRFHDRALVIYYQFGERGGIDVRLFDFLSRPLKNEECYREILGGLTRLSEHVEDTAA